MGITYAKFKIKESRKSLSEREVDFMIDSGAVYSLVPGKSLDELGIEPYKVVEFSLADGTEISRKVGDAYFEYGGEGGSVPVIYGEPEDAALLGATTLEALGLVLNPFTRTLHPMRMLMARVNKL
ncbi:MAG: aspartyl protease family protein [Bacteroidetes bacterium]|nr:aspartyl protease family protein [Bacteroidota bacterium]MBS1973829.1 aspartyl protease family protein [Bacteroidota bacterium]